MVGEHHYTPSDIDAFFLDEIDYHGLLFWYEDIKDTSKKINTAQ